ncbi:MAG: aspartate aminotransferase [Rhodobacterales bacterium]|nr:MAG: aspartate aminotransferase [Rhodobacterales bacterium]
MPSPTPESPLKLSNRLRALSGGGDAWAVFSAAREMIARGETVVDLTIGEHDFRTPGQILDAMTASARAGYTGYTAIAGDPGLRAAVAARLAARSGVATGPENVFITAGGQAALFAAHAAVLDPGQTGLFIDPFYATYPGTIRATGGVPVAVTAPAEEGFRPRAAAIAAAARAHDARSLLINTPNNPTGAVYSRDTLEEIGTVCVENGLWLISDEVYDSMIWEGEHLSPRALPALAARTLVVGSMSKAYAMTGSRVGWIAGPEEVIGQVINFAVHTTYGLPGFIQEAARFALDRGALLESEIAAPFRRRRALALGVLAGQDPVRPIPAQGAMYLLLDIRATGLSGQDFALRLLEEAHIAVMPGESFGTAAAGHVRVALTVDDAVLADALTRLAAFAGRLAG